MMILTVGDLYRIKKDIILKVKAPIKNDYGRYNLTNKHIKTTGFTFEHLNKKDVILILDRIKHDETDISIFEGDDCYYVFTIYGLRYVWLRKHAVYQYFEPVKRAAYARIKK